MHVLTQKFVLMEPKWCKTHATITLNVYQGAVIQGGVDTISSATKNVSRMVIALIQLIAAVKVIVPMQLCAREIK